MKKIFSLMCGMAIALFCTNTMMAQNEVLSATLQHGDETSIFTGVDALVSACNAAQSGDVITLSAGTFNLNRALPKSISIYGAGFEKDEITNTNVTTVCNNDLWTSISDGDLHLEGLYFNKTIRIYDFEGDENIENFSMAKCYVPGNIEIQARISNSQISQCVVTGSISGLDAQNVLISNCWIGGTVWFNTDNSAVINNSIITGFQGSANTWRNCIFTGYGQYQSYGSGLAFNCILRSDVAGWQSYGLQLTDCYTVPCSEIFADGTDAAYAATRTFELQQPIVWLGTDGTEAGIRGGNGWSKVPATPVVKNLQLQVNGAMLNVTYDAEVH